MISKLVFRSVFLSTALLLAGCYERDMAQEASLVAPDYSPDYTYINVVSPDGRTKRILVPEACLAEDTQSAADTGPKRLPPGCANNYNLQRMAARKRDLTRGGPLGPAPAAPAARAAQDYIDGKDQPTLGGGVRSSSPQDSTEPMVAKPQQQQ